MDKPTDEQVKEFWEWCGQERYYCGKEIDIQHFPRIDLNNLFKYAVPKALDKLETRFDTLTNTIRGLELLFPKWIDNLRKGYSVEDALFWAIYEVMKNS